MLSHPLVVAARCVILIVEINVCEISSAKERAQVKFSKLILIAYGLMFLYFGVLFFVRPMALANTIPLPLTDPIAVAEIRAFYGGLEIGLGAFLIAAGLLRAFIRPGLWLLLGISAGLTLGRITGITLDHATGSFIFIALAVEFGGLTLSGIALRLTHEAAPNA
jgi:hypothetical protein